MPSLSASVVKTKGWSTQAARALNARLIVALMVLLTAAPWAPVAAQDENTAVEARPWVDSWPAVLSLRGFVVNKRFYGAPGYGENPKEDYKADAYLLVLVTPVNKRASQEAEETETLDVRQVQIVVHSKRNFLRAKLRSLLGQEVYATGMLYEGNTGWYWTPIGMELLDVSMVARDTGGSDLNW